MSHVDEVVPGPVRNAARAMQGFPRPWALCGGWAVDAWLGRISRSHLDVDVAVLVDDAPALHAYLAGWNFVAHDAVEPEARHPWEGRPLEMPAHLHARPPGEDNRALLEAWVTPPKHEAARDGADFDFEFSAAVGDDWVLREEPSILRAIAKLIRQSPWGIPAVAPEVVAFYKATAYHGDPRFWGEKRPHDLADFELLLPRLGDDERAWLRRAMLTAVPDHPWLPRFG